MRYYITSEQADDACDEAIEAVRERYGEVDELDVEQVLDLDSEDALDWALWALDRIGAHSLLIRWACDCAERVLQVVIGFGRNTHTESMEAIRVARRYATGRAAIYDLREAYHEADSAAKSAAADDDVSYWVEYRLADRLADRAACDAAWYGAMVRAAYTASRHAAHCAAHCAPGSRELSTVYLMAQHAERDWQTERLRAYLRGEM